MVRKVLLIICVFVAFAAFAATPEEMIAAQAKAWEDGFNAGNAKALAATYTADALLMPPNAPAVKGPDAIAASMAPFFAGEAKMSISVRGTETAIHGDSAHRVGTWELKGADGKVVDQGKFIELWKKSAAGWQMTHDIWNSDVAPTPAPAHSH